MNAEEEFTQEKMEEFRGLIHQALEECELIMQSMNETIMGLQGHALSQNLMVRFKDNRNVVEIDLDNDTLSPAEELAKEAAILTTNLMVTKCFMMYAMMSSESWVKGSDLLFNINAHFLLHVMNLPHDNEQCSENINTMKSLCEIVGAPSIADLMSMLSGVDVIKNTLINEAIVEAMFQ